MRYWIILSVIVLLLAITLNVTLNGSYAAAQPQPPDHGTLAEQHPDTLINWQGWVIMAGLGILSWLVRDYKNKMEDKLAANCRATSRCARDVSLIVQHLQIDLPPYNDPYGGE